MLLRSVSRRHTPIFFARYRLKGFEAEFVQTFRRALFESIWTWAHPLCDQKVIKTECFRFDFAVALGVALLKAASGAFEAPLLALVKAASGAF